ncbi:TPA: substrate-binding domain-containing protein [Streptococcus suis]
MKKLLSLSLAVLSSLSLTLTAHAQEGAINVVSREDGSGTRGAFVELVEVTDEAGDDLTTLSAIIQNSTNGVLQTVAGDANAIGYVSLGSLNDDVKALKIDGVEATSETILDGEYKIARPFNLAWKKDSLSDLSKDFLAFIHSTQGQAIVEEEGFIQSKQEQEEYTGKDQEGTIEVVGSTSVTPVLEKLAEAYQEINPGVTINITSNGSSAGLESAAQGVADLGMSSRELKDEEKENLDFDAIALDGIAVIVHKDSSLEDITLENVRKIFLGELVDWEEVK